MQPDKDFNLTVGLRIREIREACNMTREQFSEKCDISDSFLSAVENGQKSITSKTLYKICTAMNVSADYIIRGNRNGFEYDMVIEMLSSMDKHSRESAIRIIREYISAIQYMNNKSSWTIPLPCIMHYKHIQQKRASGVNSAFCKRP